MRIEDSSVHWSHLNMINGFNSVLINVQLTLQIYF